MLYKRLIQNYYELHGNFDNIALSSLGDTLQKLAAQEELSVNELCYRTLGYEAVSGKSASEIAELRKMFLLNEVRKNHLLWILQLDAKEFIDVRDKLKMPDFGDKQYVFLMCYHHYRNCFKGTVDLKDISIEFYGNLKYLRAMSDSKKIFNSLNKNKNSLRYRKIQRGTEYVSGLVCSAKADISDEEFEEISKSALHCALYGLTADLSFLRDKLSQISMISTTNPDLYLALLDIANSRGITYKELMSEIGVNVPDQLLSFEQKGYAVISVGEDEVAWIMTENSTKDNILSRKVVV